MKVDRLITLVAILLIALLEFIALMRGVDGTALAISLAIIGLLAPSPLFGLKWKDIEIRKGGKEEVKHEKE
jgi:Na+/proline symporter